MNNAASGNELGAAIFIAAFSVKANIIYEKSGFTVTDQDADCKAYWEIKGKQENGTGLDEQERALENTLRYRR